MTHQMMLIIQFFHVSFFLNIGLKYILNLGGMIIDDIYDFFQHPDHSLLKCLGLENMVYLIMKNNFRYRIYKFR